MESTSRSSGDDNDGFGIDDEMIEVGCVPTTPHEEFLLAWHFLPLPRYVREVVFRHRLTGGDRCDVGDEDEEISDIL